ncbi:hypothetical protein G6011_07911 [Alternaria panax]|uniref:Uncharacterized protein n=1 Tax=Alternaria panax TaxID=48097 RepID=A0AAD4I4U7_9PLEO|nr:hypothetical protein G6011_07911 [Alternaria panax]
MPALSQEIVDDLNTGSARQTSNASCQTPAAQQTHQHTTSRNPINPDPPASQSAHQRFTQRNPGNSESYPFGPDQIVGHSTGLQYPRDRVDAVRVIVRLLLDILVYSYDIDFHELHLALAAASPHLYTANLSTRNTSLLNFQEMRVVLEYADIIHKACEAVVENTQSLLKDEDRNVIIDLIMQPAQALGIDVAYVFEQLYAFRAHRCDGGNHNKTLLYTKTSFWKRRRGLLPGKLGMDKNQKLLAHRLVSDDIAVAQLGTRSNEALALVLGKAIKQYNKKNCKYGMANIKRDVYAEPPFIALRKEAMWWELLRAKSAQDGSQPSNVKIQADWRMSMQPKFGIAERHNQALDNRSYYRMHNQPDIPPRRNSHNTRRPRSLHDLQAIQEQPERPTRPQSISNVRSIVLPRKDPAYHGLSTNF